jgi:hypothetical protein
MLEINHGPEFVVFTTRDYAATRGEATTATTWRRFVKPVKQAL